MTDNQTDNNLKKININNRKANSLALVKKTHINAQKPKITLQLTAGCL